MPDPISILGAAAAAVQFSDVTTRAILQTIKLLKNLNETPKRMAQQLQDVTKSIQRILVLRNAILAPGCTVFTQLTSQQVTRIGKVVSDADVAMKSLYQSLQLLSPPQTLNTGNAMKSFWRAVVSVTKEKDVEEKIQRINRIHQELIQELQITDLELHTSLWDLNSHILSTFETGIQDVQTSQYISKVAGDLLQSAVDHTMDEIVLVKDNTASITTSVGNIQTQLASLDQSATHINDTAIATQQRLGQLRLDFQAFHKHFSSELDSKLLQEREHTRAEIQSLRDTLLATMTGNTANLSDHELISISHLSQNKKRLLESQIQKQLLDCPSTLRQCTEKTTWKIDNERQPILNCHCRPSRSLVTIRRGAFKFENEQYNRHHPQCPFHRSNMQSKSLSLAVQLLPFFNQTMVLTLGATFGAGAWAIASPLKFYATTQRAKSPLFSAFDEFFAMHRSIEELYTPYFHSLSICDLEKVGFLLDGLIESLSRSFRDCTASGNDVDEWGYTILHEVLYLIICLENQHIHFTTQIHELFRLALLSGADRFSRVETDLTFQRWPAFDSGELRESCLTVMEMLVAKVIFTDWFQPMDIPMYDTIIQFGLEETLSWEKFINLKIGYGYSDYSKRITSPFQFINKYPNFVENHECGELILAILHRSIDEVRCSICSPTCRPYLKRKSGMFHPLTLAVGWPQGIKILLGEGCFNMEAIELAIRMNEIASLEVLLRDWSEHPFDWWSGELLESWFATGMPSSYRMMLERTSTYGSRKVRHCVVGYLERGIAKLKSVDIRIVKKRKKIGSLGLGRDCPCCNTPLIEGCIWKAVEINERPILSEPEDVSVYHFLQNGAGAIELMDTLYQSGFTAVDLGDRFQETPLLFQLSRTPFSEFDPRLLIWFLEKGANPDFNTEKSWPNIHFYVLFIASFNEHYPNWFKQILPHISHANPLQADGCECYCSSNGCLPFRQTLTCKTEGWFTKWHDLNCIRRTRTTFQSLEDWARISGVKDQQMTTLCMEACRVEVFDRLGMVHTCCSVDFDSEPLYQGLCGDSTYEIWREKVSEDKRKDIQNDEEELIEQLELIMKAYTPMHATYPENLQEFWDDWWKALDAILPDMLPEERCKAGPEESWRPAKMSEWKMRMDDERGRREEETLRRSGYLGFDFLDVISLHFKEYLLDRES